ncbi:DUF2784 family protein [Seongchinamella sediminis]|uniref:DUF2784 family protein n=1 Tax=Seongchinamella sediminis TaxID=2283635 RepID=A0A3L7DXY4_9GAMM|nr:DUF2784 family protein [Seongchinamella sediminis]
MSRESLLLLLADTVLIAHLCFVVFVVLGLVAIYSGYFRQWLWVRNRTFRILHLTAIGIVVAQSWLGVACPLTVWEVALRNKAGAEGYAGSFIQYWLHKMLYYSAPEWMFIALYTGFGGLVLLSWFLVRPNARSR